MNYPTNNLIERFNRGLLESESTHAERRKICTLAARGDRSHPYGVAAWPQVATPRTRQASSAQAIARIAMGHIAMPMPVGLWRSSLALTDRGGAGENPLGSGARRDHARASEHHAGRRAGPAGA